MATQRYQVAINGFRVQAQTWDDALNWDGKGDEVKISASVKEANKSGAITYSNQPETRVLGDTNNQPGRIKAGTLSAQGGLQTGDGYPDQTTPWLRTIPLTPQTTRDIPPFIVWSGDLTKDENAVFITPSIWEWDPGGNFWQGWLDWHRDTDAKFGQKAKDIYGGRFPLIGWIFDAISLGIQTAATLTTNGPIGSSGTRPIGMQPDANDPTGKTFTFNPKVLALTYDTAEKIIATGSPQGAGVLTFAYPEHPYFRGDYLLYLQVERIGSPVTGGQVTVRDATVAQLSQYFTQTDDHYFHVAAHRWARDQGFVAGVPCHEQSGDLRGIICFSANCADVIDATVQQLSQHFPQTDIHNLHVAAHRWARDRGFVAGAPCHEQSGDLRGIICIKAGCAETRDATVQELSQLFPQTDFHNFHVAAHRWARDRGFTAGIPCHEQSGDLRGIICIR